ncbi:hypothetical protein GpartN1_g3548.t1 [Galdieria partita]|uniref:rRNA adenine N(6)-methyltransferase n=1 Tax=Galdieria partita TaxID=83374 RepID=A0A9C7PYC8_9RHOD|nr:hypothetical protein GpartN1_g3548.t1 [Galdieria partita]
MSGYHNNVVLPAFGMMIHFQLLRTSFVNHNVKLAYSWIVKKQNKTLHITSCQQGRPDRNRSLLAKQSLGQNFLYDDNYVQKICSQVDFDVENGGKRVIEVGPGLGALTRVLHERYPNMTTIEIDTRAVDHLHSKFPQLRVIHQDVLRTDWKALAESLGGPLAIVGNLPYNITTPILFSLIKNCSHIDHAILTMQLEVALRITAKPRSKDFGVLSVFSQLHSRPSLLFHLPPSVFRPIPEVTSALVRLDFQPKKALELFKHVSMEELTQVVRTAFQQRRKRMSNSMKSLTDRLQKELPEDMKGRRAEELKPEDFVQLTEYLFGHR